MIDKMIPCLLMRGGTSRGPFFNADHLPDSREKIADILLDVLGRGPSPRPDGLGGDYSVTNKAAILSVDQDHIVQYLFAQVIPEKAYVDFSVNCGNMLTAVGPAAIEMGLISAQKAKTRVFIHNVNTRVDAESLVQTPNHKVTYQGQQKIAGVPGTAAPIELSFINPAGAITKKLLPTGSSKDMIDGLPVSLVDCVVPMVWIRAIDLSLNLTDRLTMESMPFKKKIETIRLKAGQLMGLGDCRYKVMPKVGIIATGEQGHDVDVRYLTPWELHPSLAISGGMCCVGLLLIHDSIAAGLRVNSIQDLIHIGHPSGEMKLNYEIDENQKERLIPLIKRIGVIHSARLLMRGEVIVSY